MSMSTTVHEVYRVTITPGERPDLAALRMAKYIINRWMPDHAGGVVILLAPRLASLLQHFFTRPAATEVSVDTRGITPVITEIA
jgi:hypothetical protein